MVSLTPRPPEDWPQEIDDLKSGFAGALNVYRAMAHHPALLQSWIDLRAHIVTENALGPERMEVAILRIATRLGSRYEWAHHVERASALGFSSERIEGIRGPLDKMEKADALIAGAVDSLIDDTRLSSTQVADLQEAVDLEGILDLMATVGFYKTLGCIAETFDVPLTDLKSR